MSSSPCRFLPSNFWQIAHAFLSKRKFAILPLFIYLELLFSTYDKTILFAEMFFENSNLNNSSSSLLFYASRTNLCVDNLSIDTKNNCY